VSFSLAGQAVTLVTAVRRGHRSASAHFWIQGAPSQGPNATHLHARLGGEGYLTDFHLSVRAKGWEGRVHGPQLPPPDAHDPMSTAAVAAATEAFTQQVGACVDFVCASVCT
jgi:hypothetical protein